MSPRARSQPPELPDYTYVDFLAGGGYADVFLYERHFPKQRVAIKVLRSSEKAAEREFISEANFMASLSEHPNIVTILGAAVAPDGRPYMVMEFCPPPNLGERAKPNGLAVEDVLRVGVKMAGAVEAAHLAGVLHRDIKPSNILVRSNGEPVLIDFGIAGARRGTELDEGTGVSIPYAPPEILQEESAGDERCDIYSLGATLYTLLAGRSPFEQRGGDNSVLALQTRALRLPAPPTKRTDAPESLERLLAQALAKPPADRPPSAAAFGRSLQEIERGLGYRPTEFFAQAGDAAIATRPDRSNDEDGTRGRIQVVSPEPAPIRPMPRSEAAPAAAPAAQRVDVPMAATPLADEVDLVADAYPTDVRRSKVDVPVELPVKPKQSRALVIGAAAVLVLAGGAFAFSAFMGGSKGGAEDGNTDETTGTVAADDVFPDTLNPPTGLTVVAKGGGSYLLSWIAPPGGAEKYVIERIGGATKPQTVTETSVTVNGVQGAYCVTVSSQQGNQLSAPSEEVCG